MKSQNWKFKVKMNIDLRFTSFLRRGENDLGRNINYNYDANVSRELWTGSKVQVGMRRSYYDTKFNHPNDTDRNYHSRYDDTYFEWQTPLPKNTGKFLFGHDFVRYKTNNYNDGETIVTLK